MTTGADINKHAKELINQLVLIQRAIDVQTKSMDDGDEADSGIIVKAARDRAEVAKKLAELCAPDGSRLGPG